MEQKNNKKTIRAWAMFDWANSSYNLVITSTIFPAYYVAITSGTDDKVSFFGRSFINTALSNYALIWVRLPAQVCFSLRWIRLSLELFVSHWLRWVTSAE
jgi:hypothetical protein